MTTQTHEDFEVINAEWHLVKHMNSTSKIELVDGRYEEIYTNRPWLEVKCKFPSEHRAIRMLFEKGYSPESMENLVLEWPHNSEDDGAIKVAYCRNTEHLVAQRYTKIALGKYLTRHFPTCPSNIIRDVACLFSEAKYEESDDIAQMIEWLNAGPSSCMTNMECDDHKHPYAVYAKEFGWSMIVRIEGTSIEGRALINTNPETGMKTYVRSYMNTGGYSETDTMIEAHLNNKGYEKKSSWVGLKLARIPYEGRWGEAGIVGPYLDGGDKGVIDKVDHLLIAGESHHDYWFDDTDGFYSDHNTVECECCGDDVSENDLVTVGAWQDTHVCQCCADNNYVHAVSRMGRGRMIHQDNVVEVNDTYYDIDYTETNNLVLAVDGEYYKDEDCIWCENEVEWYPKSHDDIIITEDDGLKHRDDAWYCANSEAWWSNNITPVLVDGETVHPEYVLAFETEQQTNKA